MRIFILVVVKQKYIKTGWISRKILMACSIVIIYVELFIIMAVDLKELFYSFRIDFKMAIPTNA